jgi:hypothetical protein
MQQALYKYLIIHKKLHLPGIGSFTVEEVNSRIDFSRDQLIAPAQVIRFSNEHAPAGHSFHQFIASECHLPETAAVQQFNDLLYSFRSGEAIQLQGIGKLNKTFANQYSFQPAYETADYLPVLPLREKLPVKQAPVADTVVNETVVADTEEPEAEDTPKNRWWIWALVIAILAIAAILAKKFAVQ